MANFVVSVEKIQATLTAAGSTTVDLSKSQDEAKCVPFYTHKFTVDGSDVRHNNAASLTMVDNSGTPAVQVDWFPIATTGTIVLEIFVVEFGSNITIQTGLINFTDAGSTGVDTITAVVLDNSFIHFTAEAVGTTNDDFEDACCQASFNSTTQVQFERLNVGPPEWDIRYYVVESDGTDFTTEYVEDSWTSSETGPTVAGTITAVTLAKAFLICTYESGDAGDDARESIVNHALTSTTELTWYRNHDGTPAGDGTIGVWVVSTTGTEFSVERVAADVDDATNTTFTETITEIDQTKAILLHSHGQMAAAHPISSEASGLPVDNMMNSLVFASDTSVTLSRLDTADISGANNIVRFEVVEFELESAVQDIEGSILTDADTLNHGVIARKACDQEGFRWRNDDGNEAAATFRQAQDVDETVASETTLRLRVLVDGLDDPDAESYQLEYKETGDADTEFRVVPV